MLYKKSSQIITSNKKSAVPFKFTIENSCFDCICIFGLIETRDTFNVMVQFVAKYSLVIFDIYYVKCILLKLLPNDLPFVSFFR